MNNEEILLIAFFEPLTIAMTIILSAIALLPPLFVVFGLTEYKLTKVLEIKRKD